MRAGTLDPDEQRPAHGTGGVPTGAALLLGIALSGSFDGILLHQVPEWHHLLSNVDAVGDIRTQLLADGLFHVVMYLLLVVAFLRLGRAWRQFWRAPDRRARRTCWLGSRSGR